MRSVFIFGLLALAFSNVVLAQQTTTTTTTEIKTESQTITITADKTPATTTTTTESTQNQQTTRQKPTDTTAQTYKRPDASQRQKRYVKNLFGPTALARTVFGAGVGTWRNSPDEWGDSWEGFGRRVASGLGKNAIKQTAIYALDEAFKYDSAFYRSQKKDFGSRLGNALVSPFTARNASGKRVVGIPRLVGTYTSSIVAYETWYPDRYNYKDGLRNGTISLGFNAAFNVFKEFVWKK